MDETQIEDSRRVRNIVLSYIRDGYSEGDAVSIARMLMENLLDRAEKLKGRRQSSEDGR